jgi:hypothetical protein
VVLITHHLVLGIPDDAVSIEFRAKKVAIIFGVMVRLNQWENENGE